MYCKVQDKLYSGGDIMARRSDVEIQNMTLRELKVYSDTNPLEGHRVAKQCRQVANYGDKQFIMAQKAKLFDAMCAGIKFADEM